MRSILISIILLSVFVSNAQIDTLDPDYKKFYYKSGSISSEGIIRDNQPDGYWKNYYENGELKSEGNRLNFLLDGPWKFYNDQGVLKLVITYKENIKHGLRITYTDEYRIEENFENDFKEGFTTYYDLEDRVRRTILFEKGRETGLAKFFDENGMVITLVTYKNGVAVSRENVNRLDRDSLKHGIWKSFYGNGNIQLEENYRHGKLHGYWKIYDKQGELLEIRSYENGDIVEDAEELVEFEVKRDYYPDGSVKIEGSYKDGIPDGVRKEYNRDGSLKIAYILDMGDVVAAGNLDPQGKRQGLWKLFYKGGTVKAEGEYENSVKVNEWKYYFIDGKLEQKGKYNKRGLETGLWKWYYQNGQLRKEERFTNGIRNGFMTEYSEEGEIIAEGEFIDGEEDGPWVYQEDDVRMEGSFYAGEREGEWKHYYNDSIMSFTGSYIDGVPDGKHVYYHDNGNQRIVGKYLSGRREGVWKIFDYQGLLIIKITYRNGIEMKYDNVVIKPDISDTEL